MLQPNSDFIPSSDANALGSMSPEEWLVATGRTEPTNPEMTPADERASMVMKFYEESKSSKTRSEALMMWQEADQLFRGRQWVGHEDKLSDYSIGFIINMIFSHVEKLKSLLIESIPEIEILPRQENMNAIAEGLDNFFRHEYDRNNWLIAIQNAIEEAIKHRTAFLKVFWDAEDDAGRGAVRLDAVSNYDLFLHDGAMIKDGELQSKYIIHRMSKNRNEIIGRWGVDPTGEYQKSLGLDRPRERKPANVSNFIDAVREEMQLGSGGMTGAGSTSRPPDYNEKKGSLELYECHYRDDSLVVTEGYGERKKHQLKYPAGRVITVCNGYVLHDGPNPNGFCMFVPISIAPNTTDIYGPSVVNHLSGVQFAINKSYSQIYEHTERCSNPILRMSSLTQGLNRDSNLGDPGTRIVTAESEGGAEYMIPPPLGSEVKELLSISLEIIQDISGMFDAYEGDSTKARSGVAIERLQSAAATRSNMLMMNVDQGIKVVVRNVCSLFLDNVRDDRQYRFMDEDTLAEKFGTFNAKEMTFPTRQQRIMEIQAQIDDVTYKMGVVSRLDPLRANMLKPELDKELAELEEQKLQAAILPAHDLVSIDVRVQIGTRSITKQQLINTVMVLYELELVPPQFVLKMIELPGWRDAFRMQQEMNAQRQQSDQEMIEQQFDIEKTKMDIAHADEMELEELKGTIEIAIEKLKLKAAEKKQSQAAA